MMTQGDWLRRSSITTGSYCTPLGLLAVLVLFLFTAGCNSQNSHPEFRLNMQDILVKMGHKPEDFYSRGDEEQKKNYERLEFLSTALKAAFGTPDEPYLFKETQWNPEEKKGLDLRKVQLAAGPYGGSGDGKQRGLFRQHCAHCHGVSGDGAGPTAAFLTPYPRDYRQGVFKFKSTERNAKPTTDDLKRILQEGIPGTAMPSFLLLPNDEIEALVEYVKYLSVRGQAETNMAIDLFSNEEDIEPKREAIVETYIQPVIDAWAAAEEQIVNPPARSESQTPQDLRESIAKGRELFFKKEAQCTKCHGPTGLGDGNDGGPEKDQLFDDWNKEKKPDEQEQLAYWLLPSKQPLRPRDLRMGIYRGGRRPLDIFRRIHQGIAGTPMPAGGRDEKNPAGALKPEEIWNLVDYVQSLPFEEGSEPAQFEGHEATAMVEHP
ncbi:MAG TPA: cytochrome c [Pirellulales bacterium]|nr:cytochrome c [Pirellulales bacterium]